MKHIGIIYAISTVAGDNIRANIESKLKKEDFSFKILADEQPKKAYIENKDNLSTIADIMLTSIVNMLKKVPSGENLVCLIAANSVHRAVPYLREKIKVLDFHHRIKLISMIDVSVEKCKLNTKSNVMLLASNKTIESRLYSAPLEERELTVVTLQKHNQALLNKYINQGFASIESYEIDNLCEYIRDDIKQQDADCILFGCAELGLRLNEKNLNDENSGNKIIDSSETLIKAVVDFVLKE